MLIIPSFISFYNVFYASYAVYNEIYALLRGGIERVKSQYAIFGNDILETKRGSPVDNRPFTDKLPHFVSFFFFFSFFYIWPKTARIGEILNPCHNCKSFNTTMYQEWFLCRG